MRSGSRVDRHLVLVLRRRARVDHGHARNPGDSRSGKPDNVGFVFFSDPDGNAWAENPARRRGLRLASGRYLLHGARLRDEKRNSASG